METLAFSALSALVVLAALAAVLVRDLVRSIFWFAAVLLCAAGFFVLLGTPLLAIGQLIIFVGGFIPLLLFGILFSPQDDTASHGTAFRVLQDRALAAALAAMFFLLIAGALIAVCKFRAADFVFDFRHFSVTLLIRYWEALLLGAFALCIALMTAVFFLEDRGEDRDSLTTTL